MLETDTFRKVIDELHPTLTYLTLYFQGEPYLNPDFLNFVSYASQRKIYTATSTNCHHITSAKAKETVESGLDRLIISVDGTSQDIYKQYRVGGNLDKVMEGTRHILEWKKKLNKTTPHVIWQFIVFRHNEHQLDAFKQLAKDIGVDEIGIKTAQIYDYEEGSDLIPLNSKYSRYEETVEVKGYSLKNKLLNHCWRLWQGCVMTWDGAIVPCCFDKDATHQLGNINYQPFKNIWHGAGYQSFRRKILKSRKEIDICTNCSEGTHVWNS
jgi:radical SAM protein with 4Fe4S-binding SPASM domain